MVFALQKLIEASGFAEDPEIMGHLGDVYYSLGYWKKAQSQWENALDLWKKSESEVPPQFKYETARELKAKDTIRNRLNKIKCLKVVEDSEKMLKSEKRIVSNYVQ